MRVSSKGSYFLYRNSSKGEMSFYELKGPQTHTRSLFLPFIRSEYLLNIVYAWHQWGKYALSSLVSRLSSHLSLSSIVFSIDFLLLSGNLPGIFFSVLRGFLRLSSCTMEVASFKILHMHFRVWLENDHFHVEDVEAQWSVVISEAHLIWFLAAITKLVRKARRIVSFWNLGSSTVGEQTSQSSDPVGFYVATSGLLQEVVQPSGFFQGNTRRVGRASSKCWNSSYQTWSVRNGYRAIGFQINPFTAPKIDLCW